MTKRYFIILVGLACMLAQADTETQTLLQARKGFKTTLIKKQCDEVPLSAPADPAFSIVKYPTAIGDMQAYLSTPADTTHKYPAIIWITGGFPPGGIGSWIWDSMDYDNDQSALAYHEAGVVMMYPSFRGSNGNPGQQESFLGEVDDILAALAYLRKVDYVDPERIYLGGHSTGGTLALLVAEATDNFKAIFAFGSVEAPSKYGSAPLVYDPNNKNENRLRSPIEFIDAISSPTYMIEGTSGNIADLHHIASVNTNSKLKCLSIEGSSHFKLLTPLNAYLAKKIMKTKASDKLLLTREELQSQYDNFYIALQESDDLHTLGAIRAQGTALDRPQTVKYYLWADTASPLETLASKIPASAYDVGEVSLEESSDGSKYYLLVLRKKLQLNDLKAVFRNSMAAKKLAEQNGVNFDGWFAE